jgi:hypothetical protein
MSQRRSLPVSRGCVAEVVAMRAPLNVFAGAPDGCRGVMN